MPKTDIDYSNTIIYKITCKDPKVTDVYVGHTTNFVQRKHAHKQNCINKKASSYKCKLYEVIRNNGDWQNWKMEIINFFNCHDHYEARQKEQEYFISLNATLNSIEPMPKPKPKQIYIKDDIDKHSHKEETLVGDLEQIGKNPLLFVCSLCDIETSNKRDYNKHLLTAKHANRTKLNHLESHRFSCKHCSKKYKARNSLWYHEKKCKPVPVPAPEPNKSIFITELPDNNNSLTLMVVELMKSNQELQKQMLELCKNSNTTVNSHNNNNNKTFNMQFFLNEQCKDAMNIMDFVDTFKLDFSDLERVGEIGYVESMSNIIIQKLNEMDIYKRPIHCSDVKRETLYVKDKNVWEKENGTHDKLRLAIRYIGKKNTDMLNKWCEAHPGSCDSDNYLNDIYMEMVMQAMGGRGDREENENKIMRKIARSVLIDKDM